MREPEMRRIAGWIGDILSDPDNATIRQHVRAAVEELCQHFPAPADAIS
jgi:glycine/serine hydroxymethyltransferase